MLSVSIDKAAFKAKVFELLAGSPLSSELAHPIQFTGWSTIGKVMDLAKAIVASVEIVKHNIILEHDPTGQSKFSSFLAYETAVELLDELVVFTGTFGDFLDRWDKAVIGRIIQLALTGLAGKNWTQSAKVILGI